MKKNSPLSNHGAGIKPYTMPTLKLRQLGHSKFFSIVQISA